MVAFSDLLFTVHGQYALHWAMANCDSLRRGRRSIRVQARRQREVEGAHSSVKELSEELRRQGHVNSQLKQVCMIRSCVSSE